MKKPIFFRNLGMISLALIILNISHQIWFNFAVKTSTRKEFNFSKNTSLSETVYSTLDKGNSSNQMSFSTNKWKEGKNVTKELSDLSGLSSKSKPHGRTNSTSNITRAMSGSCLNYHQYKALIYPKRIPDTYLDMVIFIPSQHWRHFL